MRLKQILDAHQKDKVKHALPLSLGDAYLLKRNPIYQNIRSAALALGFKFSSNRFYGYDALPLTQLPKILEKKVIPYLDNVTWLKEIEKKAPDVFGWNEVPPLKSNHVLHESAHGIARELKKIYFKKNKVKKSSLSKSQQIVLQSFVEEAFANAVECLANIFLEDEMDDELFYKNSYIMEKTPARKALRGAVEIMGIEAAFRLVLLSYLHANFLKAKKTDEGFDRVLKVVFFHDLNGVPKFKAKELKVLKQAFYVGLDLDPTFTIFTNSFCIRLLGVTENLYDVVDFDFLKEFEQDGPYATWLSVLSAVI